MQVKFGDVLTRGRSRTGQPDHQRPVNLLTLGVDQAGFGHQHPAVVAAIQQQAATLATIAPATANLARGEAAKRIVARAPARFNKVFFTNAGADANENAMRMARIYTGRSKILSAYRSYHGNTGGAIVATGDFRRLPNEYAQGHVHFFNPYLYRSEFGARDEAEECARALHHLRRTIECEGPHTIAAILLETVPGTAGVLVPPPGYLPGVRALCDEFGILLILDEVMTGFRVSLRGAQGHYNIDPDLTTLGKIIGAGMPVGAFGGKKKVMQHIAPTGPVYQAGTLSGNPVAMAAGLTMLDLLLEPGLYEQLSAKTARVAEGLKAAAARHGIPLAINYVGGMFGFFFTDEPEITRYEQVTRCDMERFKRFYHLMLEEGVYLAPSAYEAGFLSLAHGDKEIEHTLAAAERSFAKLAG